MENQQNPPPAALDVIPLSPAERVRRAVGMLCLVVIALAAIVLVFAWTLPFDTSGATGVVDSLFPIAFFTRVYQMQWGLLCGFVCVLTLLLRYFKRATVALVLTLAAIAPELWMGRPHSPPKTEGTSLRLLSMNLLLEARDARSALDEILTQDADVVSLQELTPRIAAELEPALAEKYPHRSVHPQENSGDGTAIFSKHPIEFEQIPVSGKQCWIRTKLVFGGQDFSLYAIHLPPPHNTNTLRENRVEVGQLLDELGQEKRPVILAGNFNFTALTPQAFALRRAGLVDAHLMAGKDRGVTWPTAVGSAVIPSVRIDTVYSRGPLVPISSKVGRRFGSDHLPVIIEYVLPKGK